jgi:hypothetical protein
MKVKLSDSRASGNGIADDYHAIQSAIDAVAAAGGGTVSLPAGNYSISRPLKWTDPDVYLAGDGAARILPSAGFQGAAAIIMGRSSVNGAPTLRGGIQNITVDLNRNQTPDLIGVQLIQTWFARIDLLRVMSPNGMAKPIQTAFQMHGGGLPGAAPETTWSANNSVRDLQVTGSFRFPVRHIGGSAGGTVNGTNYFGGLAYGNAGDKTGSFGFYIEPGAGDSTRVYGMALEDFDKAVVCCFQNNGPFDFRIEGCNTHYAAAPGITFDTPSFTGKIEEFVTSQAA